VGRSVDIAFPDHSPAALHSFFCTFRTTSPISGGGVACTLVPLVRPVSPVPQVSACPPSPNSVLLAPLQPPFLHAVLCPPCRLHFFGRWSPATGHCSLATACLPPVTNHPSPVTSHCIATHAAPACPEPFSRGVPRVCIAAHAAPVPWGRRFSQYDAPRCPYPRIAAEDYPYAVRVLGEGPYAGQSGQANFRILLGASGKG
jgi:hypothetical protein